MSEADEYAQLELYRMIKNVCDVVDVILTAPSVDQWMMSGLISDAGQEILNEYASMRNYMLGRVGGSV